MSDSTGLPAEHLRFAPYAQLVKMLVPSAGTVSIYGASDELVWCSDGYERPELRELLDTARAAAAGSSVRAGTIEVTPTGLTAFYTDLLDGAGRRLGALVVELAGTGGPARLSVAPSLLRPVVDCLQARLELEQEAPTASPQPLGKDPFTEALDDDHADTPTVLRQLLDSCVRSLPVRIAALVMPEVPLELIAADERTDPDTSRGVVADTSAKLLSWVESNDRTMLANSPGADLARGHKLLACPVRDGRRRIKGLIALYRDVSVADFDKQDAALIEYLSRRISMMLNRQHDPLTGLLSRDAFEQQAQSALDATEGSALLYIDVDRLHQVNEALGFDCGDRVLAFVADRIRSLLDAGRLAGRLGGDRFAILLPDTALEEAEALGTRFQALLTATDYVHLDQVIPVSVTIGVAASSRGAVRHLVAAAEHASKRAKQRGPGRLFASRRLTGPARAEEPERLAYTRFEDALADKALSLDAQPIMSLGDSAGRLAGFEMLVRMRGRSGEWLSAHGFLEAAEYYGMMPAIDRWVVESTLELLRAAGDTLPELPLGVSVNVSAHSATTGGYARFVLDALSRGRLPSGLMTFELKESFAAAHPSDAERFVRTLSAAGARVALDNFGAAAASVAQLRTLPVAQVKIDGQLVRRSLDDEESARLVQGLARAAHGQRVATIAEHVESEPLAARLGSLGVEFAQGYHYGRPGPLADWLARLSASELPETAAR